MSDPAIPAVPPRPIRAQKAAAAGASKLPETPPRPSANLQRRSASPSHYPHSPLYDLPSDSILGRSVSRGDDDPNLPRRPSSVTLPSLGQEGSEYADLAYTDPEPTPTAGTDAAAQTRNVGEDLHLHAPKPSLPQSSAKTQVEAVTKLTQTQAAALGMGKPGTPTQDEHDHHVATPLRDKSSLSRPESASSDRRRSLIFVEEPVHSEMGIRVPINPLLGEVQAPSPTPFGDRPATIAGHNGELGQRRRHHRTKSGREVFLPPGSYGLHGHGVHTADKFEKEWYAKHPDQYTHDEDQGHYRSTGSGRGEFALSSDDLNNIVRSTASHGAGFGRFLYCLFRVALC